jgi:hypothetical protein
LNSSSNIHPARKAFNNDATNWSLLKNAAEGYRKLVALEGPKNLLLDLCGKLRRHHQTYAVEQSRAYARIRPGWEKERRSFGAGQGTVTARMAAVDFYQQEVPTPRVSPSMFLTVYLSFDSPGSTLVSGASRSPEDVILSRVEPRINRPTQKRG